jgi:hypothetical protein
VNAWVESVSSSLEAKFPRLAFNELDQLSADALILVRRADVETGKFALLLFGINMQRHTRHGVLINLEDVIVAELLLDDGAGAFDEFVGFDALSGEHLDGAHVLFLGRADLLIFVGVDERADAFVGKDFGQQAFIHLAVDDVNALDARETGGGGVLRFGKRRGRELTLVFLQQAK